MAISSHRLDRIAEEARKLQLGRAILTILLVPLFVGGWLAAKGWQIMAFSYAALRVGWREGNMR